VDLGSDYLTWLLVGTTPLALGMVFATALRAAGDSRTPLVIGAIANLLNVFLNWVLIFGNLGAPAMGVKGAAIASTLSMVVQLVIFWWLWRSGRLLLRPSGAGFRPNRDIMRRLMMIGYPAALEGVLFQVGLLWFQRLMSAYGTAAIAAYNVGAQILSIAFLPGMGFAAAASALVGQHLGDQQPERAASSGWRSVWGGILSMSLLGVAIIALARPIAGLFSRDPEVVALTVDFIWILGAVQPLMAVEFTLGGALRGAGDTVYPLVVIFIGLFVCRLVPATILAQGFDATLQVVWSALVLDYLAKAILLIRRFRRGRWKTIEV
jgi:putative MATE family efflux protein